MACKDCFNNCGDQTSSDQCVKYTGEDIPLLGICSGDSLSMVEAAIVEHLLAALDGSGITLSQVTLLNAPFVKAALGIKSQSLVNLIQTLIDTTQTLKGLVDALVASPTSFNTSCLTGLVASPTKDQILQATITTLCSVKATVTALPATYVKVTDLTTLVQNIIRGGTTDTVPLTQQRKEKMVEYVAYEYYGDLSNFDSTGKGIATLGFDKVNLCNGNNSTPDRRGRVGVGATRNVPGPTLDAAVNPNSVENSLANVNYGLKEKAGENFHKLTVTEMVPHTHGVTDPGHGHTVPTSKDDANGGGKASVGNNETEGSLNTGNSKTNITINSAGGGNAFNVRQPLIAAYYIMYIP